MPLKRVNIGCGQSPTPGWLNYDNSLSIRLCKYSLIVSVLERFGLLGEGQKIFTSFARNSDIMWADATKYIPLENNSVDVLYASHMLEHLDREKVQLFLREAYRVLAPNGIIRIVVPDLKKLVDKYIVEGDADSFMKRALLVPERPRTLFNRLKFLIVGDRHHLWMYDGLSMARLLSETGFSEPHILGPGSTTIPNPGEIDLYERAEESVFVEAYKA